MQRDRKYFVVADEEGYISAIGKTGAKQKPFRTYVGNPRILQLERLTNAMMVVTPQAIVFANAADSSILPYACELHHLPEGSADMELVYATAEQKVNNEVRIYALTSQD